MPTNVSPAPPSPLDQRLRLSDGRWLGFSELGDAEGLPVFLFHGLPGSRLPVAAGTGDGTSGIRLIGVDRPGMGLSDYQPGRRLLDWPCDVSALADALGLARFSVLGGSAGGPYVLACAHEIPDRLGHVLVVNGMAPMDRPGGLRGYQPLAWMAWWTVRHVPVQDRMYAWMQYRMQRGDPDKLLRRMTARMAESDRMTVADREVRLAVIRHISEAFRQGSRGVARDMHLVTRPWGFRPEDIQIPVHLWQGEDDRNVPVQMGRYLAAAIPDCRARFVPRAGHLMMRDRMGEMLDVLLGEEG